MILTGFLAAGLLLNGCSGSKTAATQTKTEATPKAEAAVEDKALQPGNLGLVYTYNPKSGAWANQLAAWIEEGNGHVVRTLMATRFTAQGGYKIRSMSLPVWVKRSGLAQMEKARVDGLTAATPRAGAQKLVWDGKDDKGQAVPDGNYKVVLEATLYKNSDALFTGTFVKGGQDQDIQFDTVLDQEPEVKANRDMVTGVKAFYKGKS